MAKRLITEAVIEYDEVLIYVKELEKRQWLSDILDSDNAIVETLDAHFEDVEFLQHCLTTTYFSYNDQFYEQTSGAAMGSPISPVVANIFMEHFEEEALRKATSKPEIWYRYVDDTFVIWRHGKDELDKFLNFLNNQHTNIRFTTEIEENGMLPFLDVLVTKKTDNTLGHQVYRKPTHTDRYLHAESHHITIQPKNSRRYTHSYTELSASLTRNIYKQNSTI
ncbi:PREDICTED: uncharacterized protein LOC108778952 [Cyphomyrmex costatus]|uniref:uncharacterized protein LOC108778952 n=1 Tax=Cyphomyrmex costatus TaxID=456900 RepID=UPI000852433F|nr:PREDICTED: uncharacterized protein LOC108778952 [Cyphomyrmex costatus]